MRGVRGVATLAGSMDLGTLLSPFCVMGALGALIAGVTLARPALPGSRRLSGRGLLIAALVLAVGWNVGARFGLFTRHDLPLGGLPRLGGAACLIAAAFLAVRATRSFTRSELLLSGAPLRLDDAVARLRAGAGRVAGLFEGQLQASEQVASPGGVVCAFYEAEVRQVLGNGERGPVVCLDRGRSSLIFLRGRNVQAHVELSGPQSLVPMTVRRCNVAGKLAGELGELAAGGGDPAWDAVSLERVGKLGESCLVVGELEPGEAPGRYRIRGFAGSPALVALRDSAADAGRVLRRKGVAFAGAAAGLVLAAAYLFA